jgi:hypothetical protein
LNINKRKEVINQWLGTHSIFFATGETKVELHKLIIAHKRQVSGAALTSRTSVDNHSTHTKPKRKDLGTIKLTIFAQTTILSDLPKFPVISDSM